MILTVIEQNRKLDKKLCKDVAGEIPYGHVRSLGLPQRHHFLSLNYSNTCIVYLVPLKTNVLIKCIYMQHLPLYFFVTSLKGRLY